MDETIVVSSRWSYAWFCAEYRTLVSRIKCKRRRLEVLFYIFDNVTIIVVQFWAKKNISFYPENVPCNDTLYSRMDKFLYYLHFSFNEPHEPRKQNIFSPHCISSPNAREELGGSTLHEESCCYSYLSKWKYWVKFGPTFMFLKLSCPVNEYKLQQLFSSTPVL